MHSIKGMNTFFLNPLLKFRLSNFPNYFDVEKINFILTQPSEMNPHSTLKMSQQGVLALRHFASIVDM